MATTFHVFHLGTAASIDPSEGNDIAENAGSLIGSTFGSVGDPLKDHIHTFSPGTTGFGSGAFDAYDTNNYGVNDTFSIDGGPDQTADGGAIFNATVTYADGSTATISAVLIQDTFGNLYLLPELDYNADQVALDAKPIQSLQLNSVEANEGVIGANRYAASYAICFTAGTMIRTPTGNVPIDILSVGDLVQTMDNGPQPIRWIGRRFLDWQALRASPRLRPVMVPAGRLGNERDLLVSPQHGLIVGQDHLVRAIHAARAPRSGIRTANGKRSVTYIHLMFDAHQIIFAENTPSESLYPGPMAQQLLAPSATRELRRLFPDVFSRHSNRDHIARIYGETARAFLSKRKVADGFSQRLW